MRVLECGIRGGNTSAPFWRENTYIFQQKRRGSDTIAQYAIMRFAKQKGGAGALEAHHERTKEKYASNPDIDTERSKHNFHIVQPVQSYLRETNSRIETAGCRTRKDSGRFVDTLGTASPGFFKGKKWEEVKAFFQTAVDFLSRKIGRDNIFSAVVHMDERTPHMHLCFTPITEDGRLSAKEIIGNRAQLTKWQDAFFAHMVKSFPDIERGESASKTGRRHIPTRVFKQAVRLTRQTVQIQAVLDGINPLNAGKKKEEALALLQRFFPSMERFETQVRKYKREIDQLEKQNAALTKKAAANGKVGIAKQMEEAKLRSDYDDLRRFVDSLPDDIKRQARAQQRNKDFQR